MPKKQIKLRFRKVSTDGTRIYIDRRYNDSPSGRLQAQKALSDFRNDGARLIQNSHGTIDTRIAEGEINAPDKG